MLKSIEQLIADIKEYLLGRGRLLQLGVIEKSSKLMAWVLMTIVVLVVSLFALTFVALALTVLLAKVIPLWGACLIMGALFLIVLLVMFLLRKQMFVNPIVRKMSEIVLNKDEEEKEDEEI